MFYTIARVLVMNFIRLINGNVHVEQRDKVPQGNYILVGPHRTWWDPIFFAYAASPKQFTFMAKKELFKNPILRWILVHANAFPVDRKHPGPSVIKIPVQHLRKDDMSLIMFPTGSRYSNQLKGGAVLIAKLAKVPLVPVVYQGPLKLSGVFKRQKITIRFGDPITIDSKIKIDDASLAQVEKQMQSAFDKLDYEINPNFKYIPDTQKLAQEKENGSL